MLRYVWICCAVLGSLMATGCTATGERSAAAGAGGNRVEVFGDIDAGIGRVR